MKDNRQKFIKKIFQFCPKTMKGYFGILVGCLLSLPLCAQQNNLPRVNLDVKNTSLIKIIEELRTQTSYNFLFNSDELRSFTGISIRLQAASLEQSLDSLLIGRKTGLTYKLEDKTVVIRKAAVKSEQKTLTLKGVVVDKQKEPLPGVTIQVAGTPLGTATNINGEFTLTIPMQDGTLNISFVGLKTSYVPFSSTKNTFNIVMEEEMENLDEVVVTGVFTKAKESYTGAATTIRSSELKRVGNRNILSSIRNIDPSFNIVDNPMTGADPNRLPDITIRGNSSMTSNVKDLQSESKSTQSANLPLFIMDGFEITLERMMDLDDNQIETITLLKDASATAMYGTRGANGVVVITTKQPEAGKLQLTYKSSLAIEAPDLTSYDLLNAKEKLEYEKAAGLYTYNSGPGGNQHGLESLYNSRMLAAERGVNTYWLKYPVRTGVGHNHSLRLEGGHEEIRYAIGLSYKNVAGAMKGSDRNTLNGNVFLSYKLKNLTFQNDLQISSNQSQNSPYGTFSDYAKINSYWKPYDDEGNLLMILDDRNYSNEAYGDTYSNTVYNPLYNAYLPSIDKSKYTQITNNFAMEWCVLSELVLRGKFSVTSKNSRTDEYKPASHTSFLKYTGDDFERRGSYKMGLGERFKYEADFTLNYNKTFKDMHQLYVGLGYNFSEEKTEYYYYYAEGIPDDYSDFMGLAAFYEKNGAPYGEEGISRRTGGILNVNYVYDRRYFMDVSGKLEGSSKFGSDNRFAPFWSVGAGWNLHQEHFLRDNYVLNTARLRVSYGTSGTQNFSPYQAMRTFKYFSGQNYNGNPGSYLLGIGNPELGWQKTGQLNIGLELGMFENRLKVNVDWYNKLTDDMLADITLPLAGGFGSYKANIGKVLNRGLEVSLNAYLIRDTEREIFWSVGGTVLYNKNQIKEISNSLEFLNDELLAKDISNPSFLFKEGQSMNTIFAVRSLGIDPANGREIYLKADGHTRTYDWDAKDKVVCGVTDPKAWGNFNTMFRYKGWTFNAVFSYRWGGQMYNSTLANKVENIHPINNADKRVFYDRWKNPGDHAKYKGVTDFSTTQATTRFVADENTLECGSISLGYEWTSEWLKKNLSISYLSLTGYGEDIFRISSIKQERGTNYPFARKFSLSLSVRF